MSLNEQLFFATMTSSHPTISVIIPVYNGEKTIRETVQSVLAQSFADFELLVINDGSTDGTLAALSQIEDNRLHILTSKNVGLCKSRNRGIAVAKGDYLSFLDADDLWTADKLESQLRALERNPQAEVAYSWTDYIDEDGNWMHEGWHSQKEGDVYADMFQRCFPENGSNIMVRKRALQQIDWFDSNLCGTEDWDFYLRLAEKFQFVCVPKPQILYRMSAGSISTNILSMEQTGATVLSRTLARSRQQLKQYAAESWADYYSYLFHKAFFQAADRPSRKIAIAIFVRGMRRSPQLLKKIATRRVLRLCWDLVVSP